MLLVRQEAAAVVRKGSRLWRHNSGVSHLDRSETARRIIRVESRADAIRLIDFDQSAGAVVDLFRNRVRLLYDTARQRFADAYFPSRLADTGIRHGCGLLARRRNRLRSAECIEIREDGEVRRSGFPLRDGRNPAGSVVLRLPFRSPGGHELLFL